MADYPVSVGGFLKAIKSWTEAIEAHKPDHAKVEVEKLHIFGKLLAEDREFHELFRRNLDHCSQGNAENAMHCVYAFFNAVADASRPGNFHARHLSKEHLTQPPAEPIP